MDIEKFGQRLKKLRDGKNQTDIVKLIFEKTGVSITAQTLGRYENGKRKPDIEIIEALASTYDVSADYLLCRSNVKSTDINMKAMCEYTGLSEESVIKLKEFNEAVLESKSEDCNGIINYIDKVFSSPYFFRILLNCHQIDACSCYTPSFTDYDIVEISKKLDVDTSYIDTIVHNNDMNCGVSHPNIYKYENVSYINRLSDLFDNTPDISCYSENELLEMLGITKEELEKHRSDK